MQNKLNPIYPQHSGGTQKKGLTIYEYTLIKILAGMSANPAYADTSDETLLIMAKDRTTKLFEY